MARVRFRVPDMTCGHCEGRIRGILEGLDGVGEVVIRLEAREVELEHDPARIAWEAVAQALAEDDYAPEGPAHV